MARRPEALSGLGVFDAAFARACQREASNAPIDLRPACIGIGPLPTRPPSSHARTRHLFGDLSIRHSSSIPPILVSGWLTGPEQSQSRPLAAPRGFAVHAFSSRSMAAHHIHTAQSFCLLQTLRASFSLLLQKCRVSSIISHGPRVSGSRCVTQHTLGARRTPMPVIMHPRSAARRRAPRAARVPAAPHGRSPRLPSPAMTFAQYAGCFTLEPRSRRIRRLRASARRTEEPVLCLFSHRRKLHPRERAACCLTASPSTRCHAVDRFPRKFHVADWLSGCVW